MKSINHILMKQTVTFAKKRFEDKYTNDKKYCRVRDNWHYIGKYRDAAHSISNLKYSIPIEILVVFL